MKRRFVFTIHSIAGLVAGLFILLISLSGSILVFHEELDRLEYPSITFDRAKAIVSIDSCYHILQKQYPHAQVSHCNLPETITDPFVFTIYDSLYSNGTEPMQIFLHPLDGHILKIRSARNNFVNWVAVLHNSFHLRKTGEWLFGFFALVLLLSTITGLILYRKNILAVMTFRKRVFRKKNLHQLVGTYALLFNLMIGITGFWMQRYVFKKDFYKSYDYTPVLKASPALFFSLDSSFGKLKEQYPGFTGYVIYFAQSKKGKTAIYGSQKTNSFIHSKKLADVIFLDSAGNTVTTAFVNEIDASSRYDIINSQVHFGQYGGLGVKIIYSLFGLTSGLLGITGFLLWYKRKINKINLR
jgi:uncharacterized iron-regulated membrane protein